MGKRKDILLFGKYRGRLSLDYRDGEILYELFCSKNLEEVELLLSLTDGSKLFVKGASGSAVCPKEVAAAGVFLEGELVLRGGEAEKLWEHVIKEPPEAEEEPPVFERVLPAGTPEAEEAEEKKEGEPPPVQAEISPAQKEAARAEKKEQAASPIEGEPLVGRQAEAPVALKEAAGEESPAQKEWETQIKAPQVQGESAQKEAGGETQKEGEPAQSEAPLSEQQAQSPALQIKTPHATENCLKLMEESVQPFPYIFPDSVWEKVEYSYFAGTVYYLKGKIYEGGELLALALAVPAGKGFEPPAWLSEFDTYLEDLEKNGYWLIIRDARSGGKKNLYSLLRAR